MSLVNRQKLLGDQSSDTVLVRPVGQLAVCSEKRLAQAIGAMLDRNTECLYQSTAPPVPAANREPRFVNVGGYAWADANTIDVNNWIEGQPTGSSGQIAPMR